MELRHHQPARDLGGGSAGPLLSGVAGRLVGARKAGASLPGWPGPLPADATEAYAVQAEAMALDGRAVVGWKVGIVPETFRAALGGDRLFGPVFEGTVQSAQSAGDEACPFSVLRDGFAAVEAEFLVRIEGPVAPQTGWTAASAGARVCAVHCGVELAASPVAGIAALGPLAIVADLGINAGLILGPSLGAWEPALGDLPVSLFLDGALTRSGTAAGLPGGPLESLARLLDWLGARGETLAEGALVATGAIGGPCPVTAGQLADIAFAETARLAIAVMG